jgi:hypothetical protein
MDVGALECTGDGLGTPGVEWFTVNLSDHAFLPVRPRGLYVGIAGDIAMTSLTGVTVIFKNAAVGYHPLRPVKVLLTGTTAGDIIGLY